VRGRPGGRIGLAVTPRTLATLLGALALTSAVRAQTTSAPAESLTDSIRIDAARAFTWTEGRSSVVQLDGPVTIVLDRQTLTASRAVIWLTPSKSILPDQQDVDIVLLGGSQVVDHAEQITRSGPRLLVSATVRGSVRIKAPERLARDQSATEVYRKAQQLRPVTVDQINDIVPPVPLTGPMDISGARARVNRPTQPWKQPLPAQAPPTPTTQQVFTPSSQPVQFRADTVQTVTTSEGKVALVMSGGVTLFQRRENGDLIELLADRAVLYTPLNNLNELQEGQGKFRTVQDAITAGYLEGDVRVTFTPSTGAGSEQRLRAKRIYYEFGTDRAILTDAVIHTIDPRISVPVIVRADAVRQLAIGEWRTRNTRLTTSSFNTPSYAVAASRAYVKQVDTGDPRYGTRTQFVANNVRFDSFGIPVFWLPVAAGSVTENGFPLRQIGFGNSTRFGFETTSEWGLFETLGRLPPPGIDASVKADYFSDRGPATGVDAGYRGGFVTDTTRDPWNFEGNIRTYFVLDDGVDDLGSNRLNVDPNQNLRGQAIWQHQHFLPDDWQVQFQTAYLSDPTFREQWFNNDYLNSLPAQTSLYAKQQVDTEALSFLVSVQPNDFVTTANDAQENFEVERLPEVQYRRIGDSFGNDRFTFFSNNSVSGLKYNRSDSTPLELGFIPGFSDPGLPALGRTGTTGDYVVRGDSRQEIAYPVQLGRFKVVPYVLGRYTGYSNSPTGGNKNRLVAGTGVRINTAFWAIDDTAVSDLFDIHRLRHVIEPEVHLFTSASTVDRDELYQFDNNVDDVNDITAAQFALRQRWQTKRGGPGRWRNVDVFTLNVEGNAFVNQPNDSFLAPTNFRSLFFASQPEISVPRNGINADASWRVADTTVLLGDVNYNVDEGQLATAGVGVVVQRDTRTGYYLGTRYIEELASNITTVGASYQLSRKYLLSFSQSYDFAGKANVTSVATVQRKFDRFFVTVSVYRNENTDENGLRFNLFPEGLSPNAGLGAVENLFGSNR